jgi:hypothetical protein
MNARNLFFYSILILILGICNYYFLGRDILLFKILGLCPEQKFNTVFLKNYFSDILFSAFIILQMYYLIAKQFSAVQIKFILVLPILAEFLQLLFKALGTFDWIDVIIAAVPIVLYYFKNIIYEKTV